MLRRHNLHQHLIACTQRHITEHGHHADDFANLRSGRVLRDVAGGRLHVSARAVVGRGWSCDTYGPGSPGTAPEAHRTAANPGHSGRNYWHQHGGHYPGGDHWHQHGGHYPGGKHWHQHAS